MLKFIKKHKPRTSKIIMWLFIILFIYVIYKGVNFDYSSVTYLDTAIFCACIASVGGITGAIVTKYYNNSNAENIPRIQLNLFKDSTQIRLEYNEKMLELRNKYHASESDIMEIENESHMDDVSENILSNAIAELDTKAANLHEDIEVQNY
jgi:hypothetical protein